MGPVRSLPDLMNLIPAGTLTTLKGSGQGFASGYDHLCVNGQATTEAAGVGYVVDEVDLFEGVKGRLMGRLPWLWVRSKGAEGTFEGPVLGGCNWGERSRASRRMAQKQWGRESG
jgi:hypothetical protein